MAVSFANADKVYYSFSSNDLLLRMISEFDLLKDYLRKNMKDSNAGATFLLDSECDELCESGFSNLTIRFCAEACIKVGGFAVGTISVMDSVPREKYDSSDAALLGHISGVISKMLSLRR